MQTEEAEQSGEPAEEAQNISDCCLHLEGLLGLGDRFGVSFRVEGF